MIDTPTDNIEDLEDEGISTYDCITALACDIISLGEMIKQSATLRKNLKTRIAGETAFNVYLSETVTGISNLLRERISMAEAELINLYDVGKPSE